MSSGLVDGPDFEWREWDPKLPSGPQRCMKFDYYESYQRIAEEWPLRRIEFECIIRRKNIVHAPDPPTVWHDRIQRIFHNCDRVWNQDLCPHCKKPGSWHAVTVRLEFKGVTMSPDFFTKMREFSDAARTIKREFYLCSLQLTDGCRGVDNELAFAISRLIQSQPAVCNVFGLAGGDIDDNGALELLKSFIAVEYLPDEYMDKYRLSGPRLKYPWSYDGKYIPPMPNPNRLRDSWVQRDRILYIVPWVYLRRNRISDWFKIIDTLYQKVLQVQGLPGRVWDTSTELVCYPVKYGKHEVSENQNSCSSSYCNRKRVPLFHFPKMGDQKPSCPARVLVPRNLPGQDVRGSKQQRQSSYTTEKEFAPNAPSRSSTIHDRSEHSEHSHTSLRPSTRADLTRIAPAPRSLGARKISRGLGEEGQMMGPDSDASAKSPSWHTSHSSSQSYSSPSSPRDIRRSRRERRYSSSSYENERRRSASDSRSEYSPNRRRSDDESVRGRDRFERKRYHRRRHKSSSSSRASISASLRSSSTSLSSCPSRGRTGYGNRRGHRGR